MQDEISEMKRKFKIMSHQIEQLKEEITAKDLALVKEHFDHMKVRTWLIVASSLGKRSTRCSPSTHQRSRPSGYRLPHAARCHQAASKQGAAVDAVES